MKNWERIAIWSGVIIGVVFIILGAIYFSTLPGAKLKAERHVYTGLVTSIQTNDINTYIYFDKNTQDVTLSGKVELLIGRNYQITTDGYGNLVSAFLQDGN